MKCYSDRLRVEWRLAVRRVCAMPRTSLCRRPEAHFPRDSMFYTRAYQLRRECVGVFRCCHSQCDDDIVYLDLDKLEEYVLSGGVATNF